MRLLRVGLAQINCTVGDLNGNVAKIKEYARRAADSQVDLFVVPELAISGYPPEDLLLKARFVADCREALERVAGFSAEFKPMTLVVGCVDGETDVFNGAAIVNNGRIVDIYHKVFLPNYGVFDERRYFKSGAEGLVFSVGGVLVGVGICEDIWYERGPTQAEVADGGAELIINLNASPFHVAKGAARADMLSERARENVAAVAYVNMVGGQDELVFDGQSLVFDQAGEAIAKGRQFTEDLIVVDIDADEVSRARQGLEATDVSEAGRLPVRKLMVDIEISAASKPAVKPELPADLSLEAEVLSALELGVGDYVLKNRFSRVVVGLSGGVDSALTAAVAVRALGPDSVTTVFMPSRYTSDESAEDAAAVAANLGVELATVSIEPIFAAYTDSLAPVLKGRPADFTEENIQARVRGNILMAMANKFGWLLLSTGNKSEMSVGYTTLYGDMSGGYAVLKDVPKTLVYRLSRHINGVSRQPVIPDRVITKAPSAELREDQKDSDSLPPYEVLDPIVQAYVEEDRSIDEIVARGYAPDVVEKVAAMIDGSEYKRRQAPPGVKITARAFGRDWRPPITNRYVEGRRSRPEH